MAKKPIGLRLQPQTHEILKAIAVGMGQDCLTPQPDVTALIERAIDLYIADCRKRKRYRTGIEQVEREFAKSHQNVEGKAKVITITPARKRQSGEGDMVLPCAYPEERIREVA